jgi:hypothetical protein
MDSLQINTTIRVGTRDIKSEATYEGEGSLNLSTELPAAKAGELTTRTDDNTGVVTLSQGHGLSSGTFDVYWGTTGCRYGMTGTVNANALALDLGAGDVLPAEHTLVTVAKQVTIVAPLTGNLLVAMAVHCKKRGHVDLKSSAPASLLAINLAANRAWTWANDLDVENLLADVTLATIEASCGDSEAAGELSIPILYDAVS